MSVFVSSRISFISQTHNRIEPSGPVGGVVAEKEADRDGNGNSEHDPQERQRSRHRRHCRSYDQSNQRPCHDTNDTPGKAQDGGLDQELRTDIGLPGADWHSTANPAGSLEVRDLDYALQRLPAEQREVVLLVGLESMSYAEVALALGIPVGTVMSRLSRGRERLRSLMAGVKPEARLRVVR